MLQVKHVWRILLLALCAVNFALLCYVVGAPPVTAGFDLSPTATPFIYRLDVAPGSPGQHEGLRTGDTLDLRTLPPVVRAQWYFLGAGSARLKVDRNGRAVEVTVAPVPAPRTLFDWIVYGSVAWALAFCVMLVARRWNDGDTMLLAGALVSWTFINDSLVTPFGSPAAFLVLLLIATCAVVFFRTLPIVYALRVGGCARRIRILGYVALAAAAIAFLHDLIFPIGLYSGAFDLDMTFRPPFSALLDGTLCPLLNTLCLVAASVFAMGNERARIAWVTAALAPFYLANFASYAANFSGAGSALPAIGAVIEVSTFAVPVALTYAATSRKLFDLGFVLNRAAVFSGVSLILVAAFVLVEWALSEWMRAASHTTSVIISAAVALALGLSVHFVHTKVDAVVDTVFFRKRHENEQAIRTFALEAPYVTDKAILLQRALEIVQRHADATFAGVALNDGNGTYSGVSENDPGILRLRAKPEALNLHAVDSALKGELAYPMVARGLLVGVLLVGERRTGEAYAPDESAAIAQLATSVGVALDALSRDVEQRDLLAAIQALPDAILRRMTSKSA